MTLGVSGKLWHRSLVMYDQETNSLWSHILGEAKSGELAGTKLAQIPSVMTDWNRFREGHPDGSVVLMKRTAQRFTTKMYGRAADFGLGIARGKFAKFWSFASLRQRPVVHDTWLDQPVVILFDRASSTPRMYRRRMRDQKLSFDIVRSTNGVDEFRDRETGSTWNAVTGEAIRGPLRGEHLEPMPAFLSFARTWKAFHPQSKNY